MGKGKISSCTKGQVLIFVTLAFVVLGLLIGLAVDGGRAYLVRSRLSKVVDAAALAAAASDISSFAKAVDRACDSAKVNGFPNCGTSASNQVQVKNIASSSSTCPTPPCVEVTATQLMDTSFIRLGVLIGCTSCKNLTIAAAGTAVPPTLLDLVLVMDDTQSMLGQKIIAAKAGAHALLDRLMIAGSDSTKISLVPFRGCYNGPPCISLSSIVNLTSDGNQGSPLRTGIDSLTAIGGSGTNVCVGMKEGRDRLFGAGQRANARKVMVVLTDGDNNYNVAGTNPGLPCDFPGPDADVPINALDIDTNNRAATMRGNPDNIEIFVIRYADVVELDTLPPAADMPTQAFCSATVGLVPPYNINRWQGDNDDGDKFLGRCIASNSQAKDHYYFTPTPEAIYDAFTAIAGRLSRRLSG